MLCFCRNCFSLILKPSAESQCCGILKDGGYILVGSEESILQESTDPFFTHTMYKFDYLIIFLRFHIKKFRKTHIFFITKKSDFHSTHLIFWHYNNWLLMYISVHFFCVPRITIYILYQIKFPMIPINQFQISTQHINIIEMAISELHNVVNRCTLMVIQSIN